MKCSNILSMILLILFSIIYSTKGHHQENDHIDNIKINSNNKDNNDNEFNLYSDNPKIEQTEHNHEKYRNHQRSHTKVHKSNGDKENDIDKTFVGSDDNMDKRKEKIKKYRKKSSAKKEIITTDL